MRCYSGQHRFYAGADLHARTLSLYVHVLDHQGKTVFEEDLPAEPNAFLQAVQPLRSDLVVGAECMFARYWLADLCSFLCGSGPFGTLGGLPWVLTPSCF
jgi:hypothetical protein